MGHFLVSLASKDLRIQINVNPMSSNLQILESRPQERDIGNIPLGRMLRHDLGDDPIRRHNVQHVESLDDRGRQSHRSVTRLRFSVA